MAVQKYFSCDFETTTDENDCRVWLWAARDLYSEYWTWGTDIDSFLEWALQQDAQLSFHNLKFDGHFIIDRLERLGYEWKWQKRLGKGQYSTLISDMGAWYKITVGREGMKQLNIVDSYKLLPFKVEAIARDFKLPMLKGSIDYSLYRAPGHKPTQEELDYIKNDVDIVALALRSLYDQGMKRLTIGSCALKFCKGLFGRNFKRYFPPPVDYDTDIRQGYRGGYVFVNPFFQGKEVDEGIVLDVNSLFPWTMQDKDCLLPYGAGVWQKGEIKPDKFYPIFVQHLRCQFELKKGYLPTIQIKGDPRFKATDYLVSSHGAIVDLCLTSVDLALFKEHYNIYNLEYCSGWKFHGKGGIFKNYVDYWTAEKIKAKKEGNHSRYILAKLMLNSCYGKFATNPRADIKHPFLAGAEDLIKTITDKQPPIEPVYLPVGMFVTAWARNKTIRAAQAVGLDKFLYCDTDSLHILGTELPKGLEIDPYILGAWDHEASFKRAKYLHAKCYIEDIYTDEDGKFTNKITDTTKLKVTVAGLPASCHDQVTWENFNLGATYQGKLKPQVVPGGVILKEIPFEIRRGFIYE